MSADRMEGHYRSIWISDIHYDGDWVENCTAAVEHRDGGLDLIFWSERQGKRQPDRATQAIRVPVPAGVGAL
jgi:hypothetical protein